MMAGFEALFLFLAGVAAGAVNAIAGGGTLISFPVLVWLGRDPVIANATNTVALCPGGLASLFGFRRNLGSDRRWMLVLLVPSVVGGAIGALLLLRTPSQTFASIVPYLILFATVLFAAQAPIARRVHAGGHTHGAPHLERRHGWWMAAAFQLLVAIYGGYFGAGIGILMLAALGLIGFTDIHQMNALRHLCALSINTVAAVYFVAQWAVSWPDALVMAAGQIVGGYGGVVVARRLGRRAVRQAVVVIGLVTAALFFLRFG